MTVTEKKIRLQMNGNVIGIAVLIIFMGTFNLFLMWRSGFLLLGVIYYLIGVLTGVWSCLLAGTIIDADQEGIRVTAPHGVFAIRWDEVLAVEFQKRGVGFYAENKTFGYTLLGAGKGKKEFQEFVEQIIVERQIKVGCPAGVSRLQYQKLFKNSKVGKGWLF